MHEEKALTDRSAGVVVDDGYARIGLPVVRSCPKH